MSEIDPLLQTLRLAVFDFDGVFTDNRVWVDEHGAESVACSRADGFGLRRLREVGVDAVILTTEPVPIAAARARKLEVDCRHGLSDKLAALREEVERVARLLLDDEPAAPIVSRAA